MPKITSADVEESYRELLRALRVALRNPTVKRADIGAAVDALLLDEQEPAEVADGLYRLAAA